MGSRTDRVDLACAVLAGIDFPCDHPRAADVRILTNEEPCDSIHDHDLNGTKFDRTPLQERRQP
jgi:hypothetical protein